MTISEADRLFQELKELLEHSVALRHELIQRKIKMDFQGNVAAFSRSLETHEQPHRKTALRWATNTGFNFPKGAQKLLQLAQALDVDPFMLLDLEQVDFTEFCRLARYGMRWGKIHKALSFMNPFLEHTHEWPPQEIAALYDGQWYTHNVPHNPKKHRNHYACFVIEPELIGTSAGIQPLNPQLWHFAYRDVSFTTGDLQPHTCWRPYGLVYLLDHSIQLLNFVGLKSTIAWSDQHLCFGVETFFGEGGAEFCIASLHPFQLLEEGTKTDLPKVRFGFPE